MLDPRAQMLVATCLSCFGLLLVAGPSAAADAPPKVEARLAIKGYDPVAYFTMGRPVPGRAELGHTFDGVRYRFATAEHLEMFRRDPDRFAPRYQGLCAMGLAVKGYKVEANPEHWVIHQGRLYVTQRDFGPPGFRRDPTGAIASANRHVDALAGLPIGSALSWW